MTNFEKWMEKVNKEMKNIASVSVDDIDDFDYYNMFLSETPPKEAAQEALMNAGFPEDLIED